MAQGRLPLFCGQEFAAWEKVVTELSAHVFGVPMLLLDPESLRGKAISPVASNRLRYLWSFLRSSLPEPWQTPKLPRCRTAVDFFSGLKEIVSAKESSQIELTHQAVWDEVFSR